MTPFRLLAGPLLAVLAATSCTVAPTDPPDVSAGGAAFPVTVVDDDGVRVTIDALPQRIVTFAPSMTETLFALGLGQRIVGVSGPYDDFPPAAADLPEVGGAGDFGVDPNLEAVVALEPDLFLTIAGGDTWKQRLRDLGVTVVTLDATDLDDLLGDIRTLGEVTGATEAATALVDGMAGDIARIEAQVAGRARASCFFEVFYPPLVAAGPGTFVDDLLRRAGCDPVTADALSAYPEWSVEDLVAAPPDVYLLSSDAGVDAASVGQRPGFASIPAIAAGRVVIVDADLVTRPGPRVVDGLQALVDALATAVGA